MILLISQKRNNNKQAAHSSAIMFFVQLKSDFCIEYKCIWGPSLSKMIILQNTNQILMAIENHAIENRISWGITVIIKDLVIILLR